MVNNKGDKKSCQQLKQIPITLKSFTKKIIKCF